MSLLKGLLFIALSLQPWYADQKSEAYQDRVSRYATIATGINDTVVEVACTGNQNNCQPSWKGDPDKLGYVLLTLAYQESKLARNVHAGNCGPYQCDAYKDKDGNIRHRATSLWQIQSSKAVPYDEWKELSGLDQQSTTNAAKAAYKIFFSGYSRCGSISGGISQYAGVARCDWPRAQFRTSFAERLHRNAAHYEQQNWIRSPNNSDTKVETAKIQLGQEFCTVTKQGKGLSMSCTKQGQGRSDMIAMVD